MSFLLTFLVIQSFILGVFPNCDLFPPVNKWFEDQSSSIFTGSLAAKFEDFEAESTPLFPDLDGDNRLEFFYNNHNAWRTYVQGKFDSQKGKWDLDRNALVDWTDPLHIYGWTDDHGGAIVDLDGDGFFEFYSALGAEGGRSVGLKYSNSLFWGENDQQYPKWRAKGGIDNAVEANLHNLNGRGNSVYIADFNGDGWLDVLASNHQRNDYRLTPSRIFYNNGDRTFSMDPVFEEFIQCVIYADNSGHQSGGEPSLILQRSSCRTNSTYPNEFKDFCNSHKTRTWAVYTYDRALGHMKQVYSADSQLTLAGKKTVTVFHIQSEDINGDGRLDLMIMDRFNIFFLYAGGEGQETLSSPSLISVIPRPSNRHAIGVAAMRDYNLDGNMDLLMVCQNNDKVEQLETFMYTFVPGETPSWELVSSDDKFPLHQSPSTRGNPYRKPVDVAAVDYNNDGLSDFVFTSNPLWHLTNTLWMNQPDCTRPRFIAVVIDAPPTAPGSTHPQKCPYGIGARIGLKVNQMGENHDETRNFLKSVVSYSHGSTRRGGAQDHRYVFGLGFHGVPVRMFVKCLDETVIVDGPQLQGHIDDMVNPVVVRLS